MTPNSTNISFKQKGSMLLEALIAILIFSMGILALVGLQGTSVKLATDARYRSDASLQANQLIGQMWVSDRTPATLQTNFQGGAGNNGALYSAWVNNVALALPGVSGVAANQPIVSVVILTASAPAVSTSDQVTITIFWKSPSERASTGTLCGVVNTEAAHCYITMAQII
jgi:type IV pilus assembly protein PilV